MITPLYDGISATKGEELGVKTNVNDPLKLLLFSLWSHSTHIVK